MKQILCFALLFTLSACSKSEPLPLQEDRTAIEFRYVGPDRAQVRAQPNRSAPVVATFQRGESVSVLAKSGTWAEVRVAGGSGWMPLSETVTTVQQKQIEADNTSPQFTRPPNAVADLQLRGELVLEADVNTDGDVVSVRVLSNTTGSEGLAFKNVEELRKAKFTPVVRRGRRERFIYEHRVTY